MSSLTLDETQSKTLLSSVYSDLSGSAIRPDGIKFASRYSGDASDISQVQVESAEGILNYSYDETAAAIRAWIGSKFEGAERMEVYPS